MKIALLENHTHRLGRNCSDMVNYFLLLQEKMEKLMTFLVNKKFIKNGERYAEFSRNANIHLKRINDEEYLNKWLEFMKQLFVDVEQRKERQIIIRTKEVNELRERMREMAESRRDGNINELDKYKMMITDLRYLLRQYLENYNSESLKLMCKSLGL